MRKNQSPMVTLSVMRSTVTASTVMLVRVRREALRRAREQMERRRYISHRPVIMLWRATHD